MTTTPSKSFLAGIRQAIEMEDEQTYGPWISTYVYHIFDLTRPFHGV